MSYIVVPDENDALILENSLIKQLKPKYNILLRDDKTFPYIYIDYSESFPRPKMTRKILKSPKVKYFGPYSSGCRDMLDSLYEVLPLVQKSSGMSIQNKHLLIKQLKVRMQNLSLSNRFEDAIVLRDRISKIGRSSIRSTIDMANNENIDVVVARQSGLKVAIVRMFVRDGKIVSSTSSVINIRQPLDSFDELYKSIIINNYQTVLPNTPTAILLGEDIRYIDELKEFLSQALQKKVDLLSPKIGAKKSIVEVAKINCEELLRQVKPDGDIHDEIGKLFEFDNTPKRYEVFDNSHMAGQATVGAMVVYDDDKFIKADDRLYHLSSKDEYGQMREVLTRRAKKFDENPPPDVWLLDGGATLLKLAAEIVASTGANIDIVAISKQKIDKKSNRSKGKADDILHTAKQSYKLPHSDQNLRDMAHKKAINFHKKSKAKQDKNISLLEVHGIGKAKLTKLLSYFGTFESIKSANMDILLEVVSKTDATKIRSYFDGLSKHR